MRVFRSCRNDLLHYSLNPQVSTRSRQRCFWWTELAILRLDTDYGSAWSSQDSIFKASGNPPTFIPDATHAPIKNDEFWVQMLSTSHYFFPLLIDMWHTTRNPYNYSVPDLALQRLLPRWRSQTFWGIIMLLDETSSPMGRWAPKASTNFPCMFRGKSPWRAVSWGKPSALP